MGRTGLGQEKDEQYRRDLPPTQDPRTQEYTTPLAKEGKISSTWWGDFYIFGEVVFVFAFRINWKAFNIIEGSWSGIILATFIDPFK